MLSVFKREVKAYFLTPLGYVFIAVFILLTGFFFFSYNVAYRVTDFSVTVGNMQTILLFTVPILTMRLLAEERRNGTEQLLLTSPASLTGIVMGKYLAALFIFFVSIVLSFVYPAILSVFGGIDFLKTAGGYVGLFLLGASFIAFGLFTSSLVEHQGISAALSFGGLLILWLIEWISPLVANTTAVEVINWVSLLRRSEDLILGILEAGPLVYYLSFILLFIFLTVRIIEKRRWSEG